MVPPPSASRSHERYNTRGSPQTSKYKHFLAMEANIVNLKQSSVNVNAQLEELDEKNREFRWKAAMAYHKEAPALARIMMLQFIKSTDQATTLKARVGRGICRFCGSIFLPGNHTQRIASKSKLPKDIEKLKRMHKESSWKLKGLHKKYIASVRTRASKMIYRCLKCRKRTKLPLENAPSQKLKIKNLQPAVSHVENTPKIEKKTPGAASKSAAVLRTNKQHLLDLTKNNTRKKNKQQKKENFCQLKSLLKSHNLENKMKSRLESFLSSL